MTDTPPVPGPERSPRLLALMAVVLAGAASALLAGGVLFALATASARSVDATDRFRLLGQAANPFVAFLALGAVALVVGSREGQGPRQSASRASLGLATAVSLVVILLAVNGLLTDLTGGVDALFLVSALVSRLGTIALSAFALWLASSAKPPTKP